MKRDEKDCLACLENGACTDPHDAEEYEDQVAALKACGRWHHEGWTHGCCAYYLAQRRASDAALRWFSGPPRNPFTAPVPPPPAPMDWTPGVDNARTHWDAKAGEWHTNMARILAGPGLYPAFARAVATAKRRMAEPGWGSDL